MTPHHGDYEEIRSYLLGALSEEDCQLMDERLLTESGFLEEVLIGEEELIDDYVSDNLPADSRSRFEHHFLCTPDRQQKLRFALTLGRYTSRAAEPAVSTSQEDQSADLPKNLNWGERFKAYWGVQAPAFRYAVVVAVIAFGVAFVWLAIPRTFAPKTFATVTLSISSGDRAEGAAAARVKLTQEVDALKVFLKLPELSVPARGYRVELIDDKGVTKPLEIAGKDAQSLTVVIPAKRLTRGEYALRLYVANSNGSEQRVNGSYLFVVE